MLKKEQTGKINIVILVLIAAVALALSISAYQYFNFTSKKIVDIASREVRSNARIEVHDVSQILANKLQTVGALLSQVSHAATLFPSEKQFGRCE